ncbi:MAG: ATP synthase subunit I [Fimbriimonas sp.]|nr:ATP synthase subunit I [Fimbriimonas sp.]
MNEVLALGLILLFGGVLGAFFFGGLWWTVGKAVNAKAPAVWFLGSLILRMGLTVSGFYAASSGGLEQLLTCLLGFLLARQAVMWFTRPPQETKGYEAQETSHAP